MKYISILILIVLIFSGCNNNSDGNKKDKTSEEKSKHVQPKHFKVLMNNTDGLDSYDLVDKTISVKDGKKLIQKNELKTKFISTQNIKKLISDGNKGYYVIGSTIKKDWIKDRKFTKENFDKVMRKVSPASSAVLSSILHLDENLNVLRGQTDVKSSVVIAQDIIKVKNGTVTLFRPSYADEGLYSSSILIFLDKNNQEIRRLQFKKYILNALHLTKDNKIICSGVKLMKDKYKRAKIKEVVLVLNRNGGKLRDVILEESGPEYNTAYDRGTFIKAYKNQYIIGGVDTLVYLNKDLKTYKREYIDPYLGWKNDYYLNGMYVDNHNNLTLYGFYGRKVDERLMRKYKSADDMKGFSTVIDNAVLNNPKMKGAQYMAYDMMYREMTKDNFAVSKPFRAVILDNEDIINTVSLDVSGPPYFGAGEDGGYLFLESAKTKGDAEYGSYKVSSKQELFDENLDIRMINSEKKLYCSMMCTMIDNKLIYLSYENESYVLNRDVFIKQ